MNREITGDHDYKFGYRIRGLLNAPGGAPELFWNALGKESKVPVDHAEVSVTAPGPMLARMPQFTAAAIFRGRHHLP